MMRPAIAEPGDITAAWLSRVLTDHGALQCLYVPVQWCRGEACEAMKWNWLAQLRRTMIAVKDHDCARLLAVRG